MNISGWVQLQFDCKCFKFSCLKVCEKTFDHIVEFILFYFSNVQVLLIQHMYFMNQALEEREGDQLISMVYKS